MDHSAKQAEFSKHAVQIDKRSHASITGVRDVCSFHETEIILKVDSGTMFLTGQNLHIGKLLLEEGCVDVDGQIDGVLYETRKEKTGLSLLQWRRKK